MPGPVSVCSASTGTPNAGSSSISARKNGWFCPARISEAEHPRRDRLGPDVALVRERLRRLAEVEPLVLEPREHLEAHLLGAREDPLVQLARADRQRLPIGLDEFAEEERHVVVPWHAPESRQSSCASASGNPVCQPVHVVVVGLVV